MNKLTRREFLRLSALTAGATILAACAPQAAPTTAPTVAPTAAAKVPEALTLPIVKEPLTVSYRG